MKHVDLFCAWPAISREPAGAEPVNPLRGEEQQRKQIVTYLLQNLKLLRVYEEKERKKR